MQAITPKYNFTRPLSLLVYGSPAHRFALSFLVCRVLAGPYSIIWPSFTVAPQWLPPSLCYPCWALMIFVYILQLIWFYKIVEIAVKGDKAVRKHTAVAKR